MSELRLVPTALVGWWAVALSVLVGPVWALGLITAVAGLLVLLGHSGQAILSSITATGLVFGVMMRRREAENFKDGTFVATTASELIDGHVTLTLPTYPEPLLLFVSDETEVATGSRVLIDATLTASDHPSVGGMVAQGELKLIAPPSGVHALAALVRQRFSAVVEAGIEGEHRGLIPGMVLGDTSLQSQAAQDLYVATGLSHLSAVSGTNVTIVTVAAVMLCAALGLGPRGQTAAALVALAGFVVLVGPQPSVVRAALTGLVGLVAVVSSTRAQPIHALCLAVVVALILRPSFAVDFGFALSVAATIGVVIVSPLITRAFLRAGWPPLLASAVGVAIAADVVTSPIVALMAGRVSAVTVPVNVLVAPVSAPITVLGLIAAGVSVLVPGVAVLIVEALNPLAWWIHAVASAAAHAPVVTIAAHPLVVAVAYGWILFGLLSRRIVVTAGLTVVACGFVVQPVRHPPEVDLSELNTAYVATKDDIDEVPAGTQLIVVTDDSGRPAELPTVTRQGVAVLYPNRDGPVSVHVGGEQHARDGRF